MHRIGRVGRAGREGVAITLAEPREHRLLKTSSGSPSSAITHREGADRRRPARPPARAHPRGACRSACSRTTSTRSASVVETPRRRVRPDGRSPRPRSSSRTRLAGGAGDRGGGDPRGHAAGRAAQAARRSARQRGRNSGMTRPFRRRCGRVARHPPEGPRRRDRQRVGRAAARDIGAIEISDRFSLVEVPTSRRSRDQHAAAPTTIKGKRPTVRRERFTPKR